MHYLKYDSLHKKNTRLSESYVEINLEKLFTKALKNQHENN